MLKELFEENGQGLLLFVRLRPSSFCGVQVLEELVEENDQVPNVWLLLALALRGAGEFEAALSAGEAGPLPLPRTPPLCTHLPRMRRPSG